MTVEIEKLRFLNKERLIILSALLMPLTIKNNKQKRAVNAMRIIKFEENQSLELPRSKNICNAPTPIAMRKRPVISILVFSVAVSEMDCKVSMKAMIHTGILMKNTHRQLSHSVIKPPSVGPKTGATMTPKPQIAMALPCSLGG